MLIDLIILYTGIIPDIASIIIDYTAKLYIYHISREEYGWEEYSDFVAVSKSINPYLDSTM